MNTIMYKIKLSGDKELIKKAKKLSYVGMSKADGIALYRTMSFDTSEAVEKYLTELKISFESVSKLNSIRI